MKKVILFLAIELFVSAFFAFTSNDGVINYDFFTILGLGNLILGVVAGLIGVIVSLSGKKDKSLLVASGLLLLLGCLTCSIFPMHFNN